MTRKDFLAAVGATALITPSLKAQTAAAPAPASLSAVTPLTDLLCLDDFEAHARTVMSPMATAYITGGAADEITLGWNREKYREIRLAARAMADVSGLDCSTTLFGQRMSMPIIVSPTSSHKLVHPAGELDTARGAGLAGATMCLSSGAHTSIEDVMKVATHPIWFQLYVAKDRGHARALVQRVEAAGATAICLTVDAPVDGPRNHQDRLKFVNPPSMTFPHYVGIKEPASSVSLDAVSIPQPLSWRDVEWIRALTKLPFLLKGVMNPLDADTGIKAGVDGIIVSNHGGRCLDTQPATIEALPRVAEKVAGRVPVIVDGGIRRGTDVLKALALGASAVGIGRPAIYGLACGGAPGVERVIKLLRQELLLAMALSGRANLAAIDRSVLWT